MNKVILIGRLTRDPEINRTDKGKLVGRYTLAVPQRMKREDTDQSDADFIHIVVFDNAAEFAEKYFKKSMRVAISGRITSGSYVNKDGQRVYTTEVIALEQEFADGFRGKQNDIESKDENSNNYPEEKDETKVNKKENGMKDESSKGQEGGFKFAADDDDDLQFR